MKAEKVKAEFVNLETHVGSFRESKFGARCTMTYENLLLVLECDDKTVRVHARNIGNVHMEKKAIRVAAMNFEIAEKGSDPSVLSGSIRLEFTDQKAADAWFKELWG